MVLLLWFGCFYCCCWLVELLYLRLVAEVVPVLEYYQAEAFEAAAVGFFAESLISFIAGCKGC